MKFHADVLLVTVTKTETEAVLAGAHERTGRKAARHDLAADIKPPTHP